FSAARSRRLPMASSTACRPPSMIPRVSRRSRPRSRRWGIRGAEKGAILGALPLGVTGNTPDSGSGESWFEPRRGNSKRDATMSRVALHVFPSDCHRFCHRFSRHLFDIMNRDADLTRVAYKRFAFHVRKAPFASHKPGRIPVEGPVEVR